MKKLKKIINSHMKLQTRIILLVCLVIGIVLLITDVLISDKITTITMKNIQEKAFNIAHIVAYSPLVIDGLNNPSNAKNIQVYTNKIKNSTNVQFVVVTDINGIRKSHPDESNIGKKIVGDDFQNALKGSEYVSTAVGTLGKSFRAFVPIYDNDGKEIGIVVVGILLNKVEEVVDQSRHAIYFGIGFGILAGILGALILSKNIKKTMLGFEPLAIANLFQERNAMLKSIREGVLAIDSEGYITLVNNEAARIFQKTGINVELIGKKVDEYIPNTRLNKVLVTGEIELDQEQNLNGITILTNRIPIIVNGEITGVISTFRDKTEMIMIAEQLTGVKLYADALRAQTHEFMNKLHVILGMVHMQYYEKLSDYIKTISNKYQGEVGFIVRQFKDPALAGFIFGKISFARENNIEFKISRDSYVPEPKKTEVTHDLITILGNLIDNAVEAVDNTKSSNLISLNIGYDNEILNITFSDNGVGINNDFIKDIFIKGFSTKGENRGVGLSLVKRSIDKLNGTVNITSNKNEFTTFQICLSYEKKGDLID
ncbi:MAG TPA: DcuS/MalK family sensor histidine kinase [Clostridium sp.]|uniref:DcuS/MalK family sensor histidine kinase n=1 Tax=Clostridium sp. TaxID=1506 RepID=UPI002F9496D6